LDVLGNTVADAPPERKSAPWKVALAAYLKQETAAGDASLARQLHMGSANAVSHYVAALRHKPQPEQALLHRLITRIETGVFFRPGNLYLPRRILKRKIGLPEPVMPPPGLLGAPLTEALVVFALPDTPRVSRDMDLPANRIR